MYLFKLSLNELVCTYDHVSVNSVKTLSVTSQEDKASQ